MFLDPTWRSAQDFGDFRVSKDSPAYGKGAYAAVDR